MDWAILAAMFMVGLLGSGAHCVGMCGGIMSALTMAIPAEARAKRWWLLISYNLGRMFTYALIGFIAGYAASWFDHWGASSWLRWLAGLLLIAMGLYVANWWRGLIYLEAAGRYLWAYMQPLGKALMPVKSARQALLLGAIWGWLPCGLVYSALGSAIAQAQPLQSALVMVAFGLGTLPMLLATGMAANLLTGFLQNRALRSLMGLLIIGYGIWTIYAVSGSHQHQHAGMNHQDMHHQEMDHSAMNHDQVNHEQMNHEHLGHEGMDSMNMDDMDMTPEEMQAMDHSQMNHQQMDHSQMQAEPSSAASSTSNTQQD